MCSIDAEPAKCSTTVYPKARKPHRCDECYLPILVGEKYHKTTGLYDYSWLTYIAHLDCAELHRHIGRVHCPEGWAVGDLADAVGEHVADEPALAEMWAEILAGHVAVRAPGQLR